MDWDDVRDHGYEDTADFLSDFYASPDDIYSLHPEFSDGEWTLSINDDEIIVDLNDAMDYVFEELYDFADEYDKDWAVEYEET